MNDFVALQEEQLPRDPTLHGHGWTFKTAEHDEITMPQAIIATDARGRSCVYVPLQIKGEIVVPKS